MLSPKTVIDNANSYKLKYLETGERQYLENSIQSIFEVLAQAEFIEWMPSDRSGLFTRLGMDYLARYLAYGDEVDFTSAFEAFQNEAKQYSLDDITRSDTLCNIATLIRLDEVTQKDARIIQKTIDMYEEAFQLAPDNSDNRIKVLLNEANAYRQLNGIRGLEEDLDASIRINEELSTTISLDSPLRPSILSNYGNALRQRYETQSTIDDLEKAIVLQNEALSSNFLTQDNEPVIRYAINFSYYDKFVLTKDECYLTLAIDNVRRSIELTPDTLTIRLERVQDYATLLRRRSEINGSITDLDSAISILDETFSLNSEIHNDDWKRLHELSICLDYRHNTTGSLYDLERAISALNGAITRLPDNSPELPYLLGDFSILLGKKFNLVAEQSLLELAEQSLLRAIQIATADKDFISRCYHNLANIQARMFTLTRNLEKINQAILNRKKAIDSTISSSNELAARVAGLGMDYFSLYEFNGDYSFLKSAIRQLRKAKSMQFLNDADTAGVWCTLANYLSIRSLIKKSLKDIREAYALFERALQIAIRLASNPLLVDVSLNWAHYAVARNDWDEASRALKYALPGVDELIQIQATLGHVSGQLEKLKGLHVFASYVFLKNRDHKAAVLALEGGRARMLQQTLILRNPKIDELINKNPELAASVVAIAKQLEEEYIKELQNSTLGFEIPVSTQISNITTKWRQIVDKVRNVEGYENFARMLDFNDIQSLATKKTVVYIVPNDPEGFALIVTARGEIHEVWLPKLNTDTINHLLKDQITSFVRSAGLNYFSLIDELCSWLWSSVMGPIYSLLQSLGISEVILVTFGILGIFPLHAAWKDEPTKPSGRVYALDQLNITYIPSVGAASAIYKSTKIPFESILVVEDPTSTLQYAPIESASALMHFNIKDLIGGEAATKDEVIAHLSGKNVLHFSCHGYSDPSNPQQSGLIMANAEALKVVDIHQVRLNSTRLVVLSACQTGLIGRKLMDEVEGFPSTWLGIGVPGIISTLWSVDDRSTSILMRSFYENLKVKGLRPDEALRQAQIFLRDTPGGLYEHPFYWGAFFMTGL